MILKLKMFQEACKKILGAVETDSDLKGVVSAYDTLEVAGGANKLCLNVGNGEYYASVSLDYAVEDGFRAVIDAKVFLTLVSKLDSEDVELSINDRFLVVSSGKSTYKFPLKCDDKGMVELTKIGISSPSLEFVVSKDKLQSMLDFNSKEFGKGTISRPVQQLYYLDEEGCLTFTNNTACINSFPLSNPVQLLLNQKIVKLFKLFEDTDVRLTLGHEEVGGLAQTRVRFESGNVAITSITSNDPTLMGQFPTKSIRGMAAKQYDYAVSIETRGFLSSLDRLMLFGDTDLMNRGTGIFSFGSNGITIKDSRRINTEFVKYHSTVALPSNDVEIALGLMELKTSLENSEDEFLTINFGENEKAIVLANGNVRNVIARKLVR